MSTLHARTTQDTEAIPASGHQLAMAGCLVGIVGALVEGTANGFADLTPGTGPYQFAGDYWLTAAALPVALGAALLLVGLRTLDGGRAGRLGTIGTALALVGLAALAAVCGVSVVVGHEVQAGPTYILGTLVAFVGILLVAIGVWRVGLLPRWVAAVWPVAWGVGSFFAVSVSPWLLGAWYVVVLVLLRRTRTEA
jgi:hypothetical protein